MGFIIQPKFETLNIKVYLTPTQHSYDGINYLPGGVYTLNSAPVNIGLPASGVGYYYRITAFDCKLNFLTVAYDATQIGILPTNGGNGQLTWSPPLSSASTVFSTSFITPNISDNIVENDTISIQSDFDATIGDSLVDCYIQVEKVKL